MNELRQLGETVRKFIVQIEDENGNKKESNVVRAFKIRLSTKASYKKNPEKKKDYDKNYYEDNKDKTLKRQRKYRKLKKLKKQEKEVIEFLSELINRNNGKN